MTIYNKVISGEVSGSLTAKQLPDIQCRMVKFKAVASNTGNVYLGGAGVTVVDGTTDATSGWELSAADETEWFPVSNLNLFYIICDNATDDIVYIALE